MNVFIRFISSTPELFQLIIADYVVSSVSYILIHLIVADKVNPIIHFFAIDHTSLYFHNMQYQLYSSIFFHVISRFSVSKIVRIIINNNTMKCNSNLQQIYNNINIKSRRTFRTSPDKLFYLCIIYNILYRQQHKVRIQLDGFKHFQFYVFRLAIHNLAQY